MIIQVERDQAHWDQLKEPGFVFFFKSLLMHWRDFKVTGGAANTLEVSQHFGSYCSPRGILAMSHMLRIRAEAMANSSSPRGDTNLWQGTWRAKIPKRREGQRSEINIFPSSHLSNYQTSQGKTLRRKLWKAEWRFGSHALLKEKFRFSLWQGEGALVEVLP